LESGALPHNILPQYLVVLIVVCSFASVVVFLPPLHNPDISIFSGSFSLHAPSVFLLLRLN
jgi:hypothetical protein